MMYYRCEAIVPYYDECGQNCTYVILKDGSRMEYKMPVRSYIRKLFYAMHLDLAARNRWAAEVLRHEFNTPILVSDELVLVPVKFRKPIGAKDGCFGYVNLGAIDEVGDYSLSLVDGQRIATLSKASYVRSKMKDGEHLVYAYREFVGI